MDHPDTVLRAGSNPAWHPIPEGAAPGRTGLARQIRRAGPRRRLGKRPPQSGTGGQPARMSLRRTTWRRGRPRSTRFPGGHGAPRTARAPCGPPSPRPPFPAAALQQAAAAPTRAMARPRPAGEHLTRPGQRSSASRRAASRSSAPWKPCVARPPVQPRSPASAITAAGPAGSSPSGPGRTPALPGRRPPPRIRMTGTQPTSAPPGRTIPTTQATIQRRGKSRRRSTSSTRVQRVLTCLSCLAPPTQRARRDRGPSKRLPRHQSLRL